MRLNSLGLGAALLLAIGTSGIAGAHVSWSQTNGYMADGIAVYHLDETLLTTGATLAPAAGYLATRGLVIQAPGGTGFSSSATSVSGVFGTALRMDGSQRADSTANVGYDDPTYAGPDTNGSLPGDNTLGPDLVDKNLTIDFWLKWDPAPSASSIEIGLRSGSKLRITRDTTTPANDQFAIFATHSTFVTAPEFTNWVDVGIDEAPLDEWIHFAVTIESTGSTFDVPSGHHKYNAGTLARFYLNGHEVGSAPHTAPLAGTLDFHSESSLLTIRNISGAVTIGEVAIWSADRSNAGTATNPFANGRGSAASVENWMSYE